jgi:ribosomal protein S18 acetylase RimI-like enzyme
VHDAIRSWIRSHGGSTIWLGVLLHNERALRFWLRAGYLERERQEYRPRDGVHSIVVLMSQTLATSSKAAAG